MAVEETGRAFVVRGLGPLTVYCRDVPLDLGGRRQRVLLAILLAHLDRVVPTDRLIDGLWGEEPPQTARKALQMHVSNLRRSLGDDFPLKTAPGGYLVQSATIDYDVIDFERLVTSATAVLRADAAYASRQLCAALDMWHGPAFADIADEPGVQPEITRLNDIRLSALERRIDADLRLGRHLDLVSELETLTLEHPYRERFREQQMLALYRSGRQTDALRAYDRTREVLVEQLGIEPSPSLQQLQSQILAQASDLDHRPESDGEQFSFLATDLEDSTGLWETDAESMQEALARHDALLEEAVVANAGMVFKGTGDGIFAVFSWPGDAVQAAVDAQRSLSAETWGTSSPLRVRMAVDEGPATARDGDFFGPALNRVSRIMSSGHGGQILVPTALADRLQLDVRELGSADYKGLGRVEVAQVEVPGLETEFADLRTDRTPKVHVREGFGRAIRGYELREELGAGAFGIVFRAYQSSIGREVAIKVIRPELANRTEFVKRFEAEAQYVAQLEHPHIAPLYDYWRDPEGAYLVMQLLRGGSLADALERSPWRPPAAMQLLDQVGSALDYAHRHGVIHRDLKPANVLLDADGNAFLSDFGIATHHVEARGFAIESSVAYVSPEELAGEPAGVAADMYGLTLLAYEVLTGSRPALGGQPEPVATKRPDLPPAIDRVLERGAHPDPARRYPRVAEFLRDLRLALGAAVVSAPHESPRAPVRNPFKGLRAFRETDAQDFFGRDELVGELVDHVDRSRFTAVVGPSGSGKSSVVRAGLLPAIRRGALEVPGAVLITEMYPGTYPFEELESALGRVAVEPTDHLLDELLADDRGLVRACKHILPDDDSELVLVVDQFEELFSLTADVAARRHFLASLVEVVRDERSRVRVIATLRADFFDRPLEHPEFGAVLGANVVSVAMPRDHELAAAIAEPARLAGLEFEPGLITRMVSDVREEPGALPLLQYALTVLVDGRTTEVLGVTDYEQIGGTAGAMAAQAEEVYDSLSPDARNAAREIFLRLVTVSEHGDDTRRRARRTELETLGFASALVDSVVSAYGSSRLLSFDRDPQTRGQTIEVAHEALIREWPRFAEWIDDRRDSLLLERRLDAAVVEWERSGRDEVMLLSGGRLAQFEEWSRANDVPVPPDQRDFLARSRAASDASARRRTSLRRRVTGLVAALAVVAMVAAAVAWGQRNEANQQADAARSQEMAARDEASRAAAAEGRANRAAADADELRSAAEQRELVETARRLAVDAVATIDDDADLAVLLATEAAQRAEQSGSTVPGTMEALFATTVDHRIELRLPAWNVANTNGAIVSTSPDSGRFAAVVAPDSGRRSPSARIVDLDGSGPIVIDVDAPTSVAWKSTGEEVAVGDAGGQIWIVDPASGIPTRSIDTGELSAKVEQYTSNWITYLVPVDPQVVVGADPGDDVSATRLVVADADTGGTLLALPDVVYSKVSPSGQYLFVQHRAGARVYEIRSGEVVEEIESSFTARHFDWMAGADALWWAGTEQLTRLDVKDLTRTVVDLPDNVGTVISSLTASPDGRLLAIGDAGGVVTLVDAASFAVVDHFVGHHASITDTDWVADGRGLVSLGNFPSSQILVWDLTSPRKVEESLWVGSSSYPLRHALAPSGALVALVQDSQNIGTSSVEVWGPSAPTEPFGQPDEGVAPFGLADGVSGAGIVAASRMNSTGTRLFDVEPGEWILDVDGDLTAPLAVSPDGETFIAKRGDNELYHELFDTPRIAGIDVRTGEELWSLDGVRSGTVTLAGESAAFVKDGDVVVMSTSDGEWQTRDTPMHLIALDARTGEEISRRRLSGRYTQLVVSPDQELLATADVEGHITVIDVERFLAGDPDAEVGSTDLTARELVFGMAFNADGSQLLLPSGFLSSELLAYSVEPDMSVLWSIDIGLPVSAPQVRDGHVWLAGGDRSPAATAAGARSFGLMGIPLDLGEFVSWAETVATRDLTEAECERYLGGSCAEESYSPRLES